MSKYLIPSDIANCISTLISKKTKRNRTRYKKLTSKLLYEDTSYDVAIQKGINIVADSQLF